MAEAHDQGVRGDIPEKSLVSEDGDEGSEEEKEMVRGRVGLYYDELVQVNRSGTGACWVGNLIFNFLPGMSLYIET